MSKQEIAKAVMELPEQDRLNLARQIVASVAVEQEISQKVAAAVPGIEDVLTGKVQGLTEEQFKSTLE